MPRRRDIPAPLLAALLTLVGCGPRAAQTTIGRSEVPQASVAASAAPAPSTNVADATAADYPDPSKLLAEYDDSDLPGDGDRAPQPGKSGIAVTVRESGPDMPWLVRIENVGDTPAELFADARLLWFEVRLEGKKKSTTCKLPDQLGPTEADPRMRVTLNPGEGVIDQFDPRLYCFAEGDQKLLVPGAQITPHFGWVETPPKKLWRGGKRVEEPVLQVPPFVAQKQIDAKAIVAQNADAAAAKSDALPQESAPTSTGTTAPQNAKTKANAKPGPKKKGPPPKSQATLVAEAIAGVSDKELTGHTFTLRSDYAVWSRRSQPAKEPTEGQELPPLSLLLTQGSDARAEYNATIQMSLESPSKEPQRVYFRRELVTFEVTGPKGVSMCDPSPDDHAPEKQAFLSLTPRSKRTYSSRLAELCPRGTFATPGLYLVYARFDAKLSGEQWGLSAFTGPVVSEKPAVVRIRTGEGPLLQKRMLPLPKAKQAGEPLPPHDAGTTDAGSPSGDSKAAKP